MSFEWEIGVRQKNKYGDKFISETPMTVIADTKTEVTEKVRVAFEATYDDFRKFWSHTWVLKSVTEIAPVPQTPAPSEPAASDHTT